MAATKLYLQGEIEWAKVFEENRDKRGPNGAWEDRDGACTVVLWLDKENQKKFNESGSRISFQKAKDETGAYEVKVDDKGRKALQLRRYWTNEKFPNYGGAPDVRRIDGTEWDLEEDGLVGNGSVGIACVTIYDTNTGKGTRLEGLQVLTMSSLSLKAVEAPCSKTVLVALARNLHLNQRLSLHQVASIRYQVASTTSFPFEFNNWRETRTELSSMHQVTLISIRLKKLSLN